MVENTLKKLQELGQSPWLDFVDRELLGSGTLADMVERGVRGVTSNPAIFEKAIGQTTQYDAAIAELAASGVEAGEIYERLAIEDIRAAADALRPVFEGSGGADGFVSLELSPHLVDDTEGTLAEARRLWPAVDRPNLMLKVPGTAAGLPAIRQLIAEGMNINITLLFSLERYRQVVHAYLEGLEDAAAAGKDLAGINSVASFFLSRIDSVVDPKLDHMVVEGGTQAAHAKRLRGEIAVASAKRAYVIFGKMFHAKRFRDLERQGARVQRLLWASTGTKNPGYSDVKYVEPLIGPDTVSTMPLETLEAFEDHGRVDATLEQSQEGAAQQLKDLSALGIDLDDICRRLLAEGVEKFVQPFDALHEAIEQKRRAVPQ
jgi:transaldolase